MFIELDLEFDEDDFEELLLDLEDLEEFSENFSQYDWIFDTKSITLEFSLNTPGKFGTDLDTEQIQVFDYVYL